MAKKSNQTADTFLKIGNNNVSFCVKTFCTYSKSDFIDLFKKTHGEIVDLDNAHARIIERAKELGFLTEKKKSESEKA